MRIWLLALCGLLALLAAGCGDSAPTETPEPAITTIAAPTEVSEVSTPPEPTSTPTPTPSPTLVPAPSPIPTTAPSPTPTPSGQIQSRPEDASATVTTVDGLVLTVVSVTLDASEIVLEGDPLNAPAAAGRRFTMIRLRVVNMDGAIDSEVSIASTQFGLVGSSGTVFSAADHSCGVVPDELSLSLVRGGTGEGNVCFEIPESESDLVLFFYPSDSPDGSDRRWLKVAERDAEEPARSVEATPETAPAVEPEPDPQLDQIVLHSYRLSQDVALSPAFGADTIAYTASVPYEADQITVTAVPGNGVASTFVEDDGVTVQSDNDGETPGHQVNLAPGENVIMIRAAVGQASRVYTISVERDKPIINLIAQATTVGEGAILEFTVLRTPVAADDLEVTITVSESGDFVRAGDEGFKKVSIPANAASATLTVLTDPDDDAWDLHSVVSVALEEGDHYAVGPEYLSEVDVRDDDFPELVAVLTTHPNPVVEGGTVTATLTLTTVQNQKPHSDGGSIEIYALDGKARLLQDYEGCRITYQVSPEDFRAVEVGGATRYRAAYSATFNTVEDAVDEGVEEFSVVVAETGEDMKSLLQPSRLDIFIAEDVQSTEELTEPAPEANGGLGPQLENFCLAHGEPSEAMALSPDFDASILTYTAGVPYEVIQATLTVIAGTGASSVVVGEDGVTPRPDADGDSPGYQVDLAPGDNFINVKAVAEGASQTYAIKVVRARPTVRVRVWTSAAVGENDPLNFTVTRGVSVPDELKVSIDVAETGDFVDEDQEGIKTVTIEANAASAAHVVYTDADDISWDPHSTVTVTVQEDDTYWVGSSGSAKIEVRDDDLPETVAVLTADPNPIAEGETVHITLILTTVADQEPHLSPDEYTTVSIVAREGTATAPDDFESWGSVYFVSTGSFSPIYEDGSRRFRATFPASYTAFEDDLPEGDETFRVLINDPVHPNISLGEPSSVTIIISD